MSNLDSIIACDALVFLRYMILTYLAYLNQASFYEKFSDLRKKHTTNVFGMKLLKFFFNKLKFIINEICSLIKKNQNEKAINLLEYVAKFNPNINLTPLI